MQTVAVDFVYRAGYSVARRYPKFWTAFAKTEFKRAAQELGHGEWCEDNKDRCFAHARTMWSEPCGYRVAVVQDTRFPTTRGIGNFYFEELTAEDKEWTTGMGQRYKPPYRSDSGDPFSGPFRGDKTFMQWRQPGDDGYTPASLITECVDPG